MVNFFTLPSYSQVLESATGAWKQVFRWGLLLHRFCSRWSQGSTQAAHLVQKPILSTSHGMIGETRKNYHWTNTPLASDNYMYLLHLTTFDTTWPSGNIHLPQQGEFNVGNKPPFDTHKILNDRRANTRYVGSWIKYLIVFVMCQKDFTWHQRWKYVRKLQICL